jgi:hypothetical protein
MTGVRRSGRIPKQIPILLLGTDTSGRVFSEKTHTLVLSRHGAGILSRNRFAQDEVLTMRLRDSGREADIRLVGRLGEDPRGYVYGVAFCDPRLDFWQIEFPPPSQPYLQPPGIALQCAICGERALVEQSEVESDVFLVNQSVLRFCNSCGQTTPWKQATGDAPAKPAKFAEPPKISAPPEPKPAGAPSLGFKDGSSSSPEVTVPLQAPIPVFAPVLPEPSAYSSGLSEQLVTDNSFSSQPAPQPAASVEVAIQNPPPKPKPAAPPAFSAGGKPNRRRHVRTRVNFMACIRVNYSGEETVECDNISKGGLCFRSRKPYSENAAVEVAVPYSPGQPAIFVRAQIRRVEALSSGLFRYGVAYL